MPHAPLGMSMYLTQLCLFPAHRPAHGSTWKWEINTSHCTQGLFSCIQAVFNDHPDHKQHESEQDIFMDCPTNMGCWWNMQVLEISGWVTSFYSSHKERDFFLNWQISCINTWCCDRVYVQRDAGMYKSLALRDIKVPKSCYNLHILSQRLHLQQQGHNLGYTWWTLPTEGGFAPQGLGKPWASPVGPRSAQCLPGPCSNPMLTLLRAVIHTCWWTCRLPVNSPRSPGE